MSRDGRKEARQETLPYNFVFYSEGPSFFARLAAWGSPTWIGENNITRKNGGGGNIKFDSARERRQKKPESLGGRLQAGTTVFQEEDAVDVVCEKGIKTPFERHQL